MWKILIAHIKGEINYSLVCQELFPDKEKGYRSRTRETHDQGEKDEEEKIDIDDKKGYDMVNWIPGL